MNFVSDARLAIACNRAGIVPSLVGNDKIKEQLEEFRDSCPSGNLILACIPSKLTPGFLNLMKMYRVSHIQLLSYLGSDFMLYRKIAADIKVIHKSLNPENVFSMSKMIDAVDLKSPDAASRVIDTNQTTMERFLEQKATNPNLPIIVTGGISTSAEIKMYLDAGAEAVGLGTMFALSEESRIHPDKKLEMIKKSFSDVTSLGENRMNAIVFTETEDTDNNHTDGLKLGRDTKDEGLLFAGKALDNINAIESVQTIVDRLTRGL
jgi:NAD(P)H-dependent flavin oxidoreductase YrpB (nitropropane dioxygenase family)